MVFLSFPDGGLGRRQWDFQSQDHYFFPTGISKQYRSLFNVFRIEIQVYPWQNINLISTTFGYGD